MSREILSLIWRAPGPRFNSAAVTQGVSSLWPLVTSVVNKHMSTLVLVRGEHGS